MNLYTCGFVDMCICVTAVRPLMICMYVSLHCMCQSGQIIFHRTAEHYLRNNLCNTLFLVPHFWGKLCNCQTKCTCHLIIDLFPTLKNLTVLNIALNNLQLKYGVWCVSTVGRRCRNWWKNRQIGQTLPIGQIANRENCKSGRPLNLLKCTLMLAFRVFNCWTA